MNDLTNNLNKDNYISELYNININNENIDKPQNKELLMKYLDLFNKIESNNNNYDISNIPSYLAIKNEILYNKNYDLTCIYLELLYLIHLINTELNNRINELDILNHINNDRINQITDRLDFIDSKLNL